jgi:predicted HTH transcriptional regulator
VTEAEFKIVLSDLRAYPVETEWVEFKINNDQEIGEYISALSNSACIHDEAFGYLVFGVEDKSHRIVGTTFNYNKKGKGNEDLIPWLARLLNPRVNFDFFEETIDGNRVVICRIQAIVNTPVTFNGKAHIRIGSSKKQLDQFPEKQRLIWTKAPATVFESGMAIEGIDSDEVLNLLDYPAYFELLQIPLPDNRDAIFDKLIQERLISITNGLYSISNLGAILFARELDRFDSLSRKAIRVIIYQGKNKFKTRKEQLGQKGYASGFKGLVGYINDQLPMNEKIGKVFRKEVKMFPELAIRELVANALIHQDFSEKGTGPMIEIYDDRVEITNPGKPLISTNRFIDHNPQSRNEKLAQFMRRANICEERGSGIDKVIFECEYYQLPAPKIIEGENYTRVILYAYKTLRQMDRDDKNRATYSHASLKFVSNEFMTNQSLRERFGIAEKNYSMASRIIAESIKSGLVKDSDPDNKSKKHAKYVPFWA